MTFYKNNVLTHQGILLSPDALTGLQSPRESLDIAWVELQCPCTVVHDRQVVAHLKGNRNL